jgi:hypothetical protein
MEKDLRSRFPGSLECIRCRIEEVWVNENDRILVKVGRDIYVVDRMKFELDEVVFYLNQDVFVTFTNNNGYKCICDIMSVLERS